MYVEIGIKAIRESKQVIEMHSSLNEYFTAYEVLVQKRGSSEASTGFFGGENAPSAYMLSRAAAGGPEG